jgi:hypothetical protein
VFNKTVDTRIEVDMLATHMGATMRKAPLGFVFAGALVACGNSGGSMPPGGDDDNMPDAGTPGDNPAFEVVSKDAMLAPGEQITYCYFFHTSNTTDVLINRWVSDMTPASHHAILFLNPGGNQPADGTLDTSGCGGLNGTSAPIWTYATQTAHQEEILPTDDGNGKPLAQKIAANTPAVFQLHYLNATDNPIAAHIDLKAYALAPGAAYTQTDAYVTYNNDISVPAGATNFKVAASCPLPSGVKFWTMSTHSHKQSAETSVSDGTSMLFQSTDWEHPGAMNWGSNPFYTFTATKLSWECTYNNNAPPPYCDQGGPAADCSNADVTVKAGQSAVTNEMCMATGYFFPATGPKFEVVAGGNCFSL